MGINKFNCEGYYDPTAYEALTRIENEARKLRSFRPVVYICSPLSGDLEGNQEKAARYCRFAVDAGYIPIAPHLYFPRFMDDANPRERDLALFMDIVLLTKCAELWVFGDNVSKGMSIEIEKAKRKGQTIRYFTENCQEVSVKTRLSAPCWVRIFALPTAGISPMRMIPAFITTPLTWRNYTNYEF